jgi:hypothetical protein
MNESIMQEVHRIEADKFIDLINRHPEKPWDWESISYKPIFDMEYVDAHPDIPWNWKGISTNASLTMEYIKNNPDKPWDWGGISLYSPYIIELVNKYPDKPWNWKFMSENKHITFEFLKQHRDKPWDWKEVGKTVTLSIELIEEFPKILDKYGLTGRPGSKFKYRCLSHTPNLLSENNSLTFNILKKYIHKPWNWKDVSRCKNITMDIMNSNPDLPWDWSGITANPNISTQYIFEHPELPWDYDMIDEKPDFDLNALLRIKDTPIYNQIDWDYIATESKDIVNIIESFVDKESEHINTDWSDFWKCVSYNDHLSLEFIEKYIDKPWDWVYISSSKLLPDIKKTEQGVRKKYKKKIQMGVERKFSKHTGVKNPLLSKMIADMVV